MVCTLHPGQPLYRNGRVVTSSTPPHHGFGSNLVGLKSVATQVPREGRGDGDFGEGIEGRLGLEVANEFLTTLFQEADVRVTISDKFLFKIKVIVWVVGLAADLLVVPAIKFLLLFEGHTVRVVEVAVG